MSKASPQTVEKARRLLEKIDFYSPILRFLTELTIEKGSEESVGELIGEMENLIAAKEKAYDEFREKTVRLLKSRLSDKLLSSDK